VKLLKRHESGFYYYVNSEKCNDNEKPRRIIFLDRDGVINVDSEEFIKTWSEYMFCPGSLEAIRMLTRYHFIPVIISNQSGINRNILTLENLDEITVNMIAEIEKAGGFVGAVCYCPHEPEEACGCRKPAIKMLNFSLSRIKATSENIYFVGDRQTDVQTAINFGATPILIDGSMEEEEIRPLETEIPGHTCPSLLTAVKKIILAP